MENKILKTVDEYYTEKVNQHGATPLGVDWNGIESQTLRFEQLCEGFLTAKEKISILDYGCGFGSLIEFLQIKNLNFNYNGFDISEKMLSEGKRKFPSNDFKWTNNAGGLLPLDYLVASGIFNVKMKWQKKEWENYIFETLVTMNRLAEKEFSFNMLTSYSDAEFMKDYLYYGSPEFFFGFCKTEFSKKVILNHGYPLYEFTIRVIK